jgi:hypothetical protein
MYRQLAVVSARFGDLERAREHMRRAERAARKTHA